MKKRTLNQRLSLKKKMIGPLTAQHITGGLPVTFGCPPNYTAVCPAPVNTRQQACTAAPDLCQPSYIVTGCPSVGCPTGGQFCTIGTPESPCV